MYIEGVDFPKELIDAIRDDNLVVFAGAGVSKGEPSNLPDFRELANEIAAGTGKQCDENFPVDRFLGQLKSQNIDTNSMAAKVIRDKCIKHNKLHDGIINLFSDINKLKIVTTNYDNLFEKALKEREQTVQVFNAPALPLGNDIAGIIHIHGHMDNPKYMVVTDDDFGVAYLSEGFVSRFLVKLFETYTVLFVGYSYNDVIVNYLTRGVRRYSTKPKFILTDDHSAAWSDLEITPIYFKNRNFEMLNNAVSTLGRTMKRGLFDWKNQFSMLTDIPPIDPVEIAEIEFALEDIAKCRLLSNNIHGETWLWWLDERDIFHNLLAQHTSYDEKDSLWAQWIITEFFAEHIDIVKKLIEQHKNCIHSEFSSQALYWIVDNANLLSDKVFQEYVQLLVDDDTSKWKIFKLNEISIERNLIDLGWDLFKKIFEFEIRLEKEFWGEGTSYQHIFKGEHTIDMAWKRSRETYINNRPLDVMLFGYTLLNDLHFKYEQVQKASDVNEPFDMLRLSLEKEPDFHNYSKKALYYIAKMIIEAEKVLGDIETGFIRWYIRSCVQSKSVLLRRVGLKILRQTMVYTADEKAQLILDCKMIYALWEKEEVYHLVAEILDSLSNTQRLSILDAISFGGSETNPHWDEKTIAYGKYNWGVWLQRNCALNTDVEIIIESVLQEYAYFQPRENPELNFDDSFVTWGTGKSPITVEEMHEMDLTALVDYLKNYNGDETRTYSRDAMLNTFAKCIQANSWTRKIIQKLYSDKVWETDIWEAVFEGLKSLQLTVEKIVSLFSKLNNEEFINKMGYELTRFFEEALRRKEIQEDISKYHDELYDIMIKLWRYSDKTDRLVGEYSAITKCINTIPGLLSLSCMIILIHETKSEIPQKYKYLFRSLLKDNIQGRQEIICTLVGYAAPLLYRDKDWCEVNILPFLRSDDLNDFVAAWDGITWYYNLDNVLGNSLASYYLDAMNRINQFERNLRNRFIEYYIALTIYVIENPFQEYIPRFFDNADKEDRQLFISQIQVYLHGMDSDEKQRFWTEYLKPYWENRLANIPVPLELYEVEEMLRWLVDLDAFYDECIDLIIKGPQNGNYDGSIFIKLKDKDELIATYPDKTAQLLIFLLKSQMRIRHYENYLQEIVSKINCTDVALNQVLQEALLRCGIQ